MRYWVDIDLTDVTRLRQRIKLRTGLDLDSKEVQFFMNYALAVVISDFSRLGYLRKYDLQKLIRTWIEDLDKTGRYGLLRFPHTPGAEKAVTSA